MRKTPASRNADRSRLVILAAGCAAFMNILDGTIVNVSLPSVVHDLKVDTDVGVWIILAYSVTLAGTVLAFGKLADRLGMGRVMTWGYLLFTGSSLLCGLAPTATVLVAGRLLQGIGGGMLSATSLGAVGSYLPPERRGWGIGIVSAASALGAMLGAPIGGFLSEMAGWRWIFLVNLPVGLFAWYIVSFRFPRDAGTMANLNRRTIGIDPAGVLLSVVALGSLLYGITRGPDDGWLSAPVLGSLLSAAFFSVAFLFRERRSPDPLLNWSLFRDRRFLVANLANFFTSMFVAGVNFLFPFYLIYVQGLGQAVTGAVLILFSGVYVLVSPVAGRMSDRIGVRLLTTGGMALASGGLLVFTFLAGAPSMAAPVGLLVLLGVAYGLYLSPNNRQILNLAPPQGQGSASGVLRLLFYLGQPLGVALAEAALRDGLPETVLSVSQWRSLPVAELVTAFQGGFIICAVVAALAACCSLFSSGRGKTPRP
ncbi:MAG: DHA2 family efflux MFS transporter permease subunit [Syntrophaceae bacterium]|nr:DHA2 family efflux MFS transporter permease subunit [Syntrophaceae bacterium]